jgi:hypothetical protein
MKALYNQLISAGILFGSFKGSTQDKCIPENVYFTDSVGNMSFKMPQRFAHKINENQLRIYLSDTTTPPLIKFRILKTGCEEEKPGLHTIQLDLINELNPQKVECRYNIRYNYLGAYQIELLYPNNEPRIFYIDQQKEYFKKQQ